MTLPEADSLSKSLNGQTNVLADANVSKLISLVQGYVSVQENAPIININLILIEYVSNSVLPTSFQSFRDLIYFEPVINNIFVVRLAVYDVNINTGCVCFS